MTKRDAERVVTALFEGMSKYDATGAVEALNATFPRLPWLTLLRTELRRREKEYKAFLRREAERERQAEAERRRQEAAERRSLRISPADRAMLNDLIAEHKAREAAEPADG